MDDFREQLSAVIETMRLEGNQPVFLVVDLDGIEYLKKVHGAESVEKFRAASVEAVSAAAQGSDAFTYGENRIVAILAGYDRLKTFALIDKLRRSLPFLGQSFDCVLTPEFDVLASYPLRSPR